MKYILTIVFVFTLCCNLVGCAAAPTLGKADTTGFDAANATVLIEYAVPVGETLSADEVTTLRNLRYEEIKKVLQEHGFSTVLNGTANFHIKITESAATDITGEWTGAAGATAALFTLGLVPAVFTYSSRMHYELWAEQALIHTIDTPAQWDEAFGLVSLSSTLSGTDAARAKARTDAHDSVIRLWIEQGSFE